MSIDTGNRATSIIPSIGGSIKTPSTSNRAVSGKSVLGNSILEEINTTLDFLFLPDTRFATGMREVIVNNYLELIIAAAESNGVKNLESTSKEYISEVRSINTDFSVRQLHIADDIPCYLKDKTHLKNTTNANNLTQSIGNSSDVINVSAKNNGCWAHVFGMTREHFCQELIDVVDKKIPIPDSQHEASKVKYQYLIKALLRAAVGVISQQPSFVQNYINKATDFDVSAQDLMNAIEKDIFRGCLKAPEENDHHLALDKIKPGFTLKDVVIAYLTKVAASKNMLEVGQYSEQGLYAALAVYSGYEILVYNYNPQPGSPGGSPISDAELVVTFSPNLVEDNQRTAEQVNKQVRVLFDSSKKHYLRLN